MSSCNVLNKRNSQLALKIEVTEGTAETLAAADAAIQANDPVFQIEVKRLFSGYTPSVAVEWK